MAHFRGTLGGSTKHSVSRLGNKKTGLQSTLNTLQAVIHTNLSFDPETGKNVATVHVTKAVMEGKNLVGEQATKGFSFKFNCDELAQKDFKTLDFLSLL